MHLSLFRRLERTFGDGPRLSRRGMLQAALAAAAASAFEQVASTAASAGARRVVVVGGGFGGLRCALALRQAGCDVVVVEARLRLGGRVRTISNLVPGKTVEAGGELIGLNQPEWLACAARYKLELAELPEDPIDRSPIVWDGRPLSAADSTALWRDMRQSLMSLCDAAKDVDAEAPWTGAEAERLDRRSTAEWIDGLPVDKLCRRALTIQLTSINGMLPSWQSFLGNLAMVKGGGLQDYWTKTDALVCRGGNQQLAERMADDLGRERIRFGVPAAAIDTTPDRVVRVELADGTALEADDVVLAVPTSCWGRIRFDPPLPAALVPQMGANTKYLAALAKPVWKESNRTARMLTDGPIALSWHSTSTQPGASGEVLTLYAGGPTADLAQDWTEAERQDRYLTALERAYPGARDAFVRAQFFNWQNDPFARGSYSFPAPGQVTTIGPLLESGLGRLHFVGEHCTPAFIGYMEGALQSGLRIARRLA